MFRLCHMQAALDLQSKLLLVLPKDSPDYRFNEAEYNFLRGRNEVARVLLEEFMNTDPNAKLRSEGGPSSVVDCQEQW